MFAQEPIPTTPATVAAATRPKEDIQGAVRSNDFLLYSVILALLLLAAAGVFYFVDRWRKTQSHRETEREASLSMSAFREMYENGEITESEYQRVRDKLAARLKVPTAGGGPPPAPGVRPPVEPATNGQPPPTSTPPEPAS